MKDVRPEELLAAWADDPAALDDDERAAVEALCAREPAARAEAEAARRLIGAVRDLPAPEVPPELGRAIAAAVDRAATSRWARLVAWLGRPRVALPAVVMAGAVLAVVAVGRRRGGDAGEPAARTSAVPDRAPRPTAPAALFQGEPATAGELADLGGLDDDALARLTDELDDDAGWAPDPLVDEPLDEPAAAPLAVGGADDGAADDDLGILPDPDLGWVDQLSSAQVDSLDQWLEQHRSPT